MSKTSLSHTSLIVLNPCLAIRIELNVMTKILLFTGLKNHRKIWCRVATPKQLVMRKQKCKTGGSLPSMAHPKKLLPLLLTGDYRHGTTKPDLNYCSLQCFLHNPTVKEGGKTHHYVHLEDNSIERPDLRDPLALSFPIDHWATAPAPAPAPAPPGSATRQGSHLACM